MKNFIEDVIDADNIDDITEAVKKRKFKFLKILIPIILALILVLIGGIAGWSLHARLTKEEPVDVDYLSGKLSDASDLTTQTITYTSRVPMSDGSIPFINKKSFVMYYTATVRAGVDLSDVDIKAYNNDKIIVKITHAKVIGNPDIDPNSIKFFDEKKAILNWNTKEDVAEALSEARSDIETNESINLTLLLSRADTHAEELIHALLDDVYNDCEIIVKFK